MSLNKDEKGNSVENVREKGTVKDGGWGWMILVGSCLIMGLCAAQGPCFGIFLKDQMNKYSAPDFLPSLIFNILSFMYTFSASWTGILIKRYGNKIVAALGALITVLGIFASAFVTNPYYFILLFAIPSGIGGGVAVTTALFILNEYFDKRLGFANGVVITGGALGRILLPQLAVYLQEVYSFTGATLITGAVILHSVFGALLFRPLKKSGKQSSFKSINEEKSNQEDSLLEIKTNNVDDNSNVEELEKLNNQKDSEKEKDESTSLLKQYVEVFKDNKVIKNYKAIGTSVVNCLVITAGFNFVGLIPFILGEKGFVAIEIALAMSTVAISDLVLRIIMSFTLDLPCSNPRVLFTLSQTFIIISLFAIIVVPKSLWMMLACLSLYGIGLGTCHLLDVYIIIKELGSDLLHSVYGISQIFRAASCIIFALFLALLPYVTGTYASSVLFLAAVQITALIIALLITRKTRKT